MDTVVMPLVRGVGALLASCWWLLVILLSARFGPRMVRGILLRRGGLQ